MVLYTLSVLLEVEQEAKDPAKGRKPSRKVSSRELRNLALPDREWNIAMPYCSQASPARVGHRMQTARVALCRRREPMLRGVLGSDLAVTVADGPRA